MRITPIEKQIKSTMNIEATATETKAPDSKHTPRFTH